MLKNFEKIKGYAVFMQGAQFVLANTLRDFFSSEVKLYFKPLRELLTKYNISISDSPKRNVYVLDDDHILLVTRAQVETDTYYLGILLTAKFIGSMRKKKFFNVLAIAISSSLTESYKTACRSAVVLLNENLIKQAIARFVSIGFYNAYKVYNLIEFFNAIRTTTFEGKYFSTGLIASRSLKRYKQIDPLLKVGDLLSLKSRKNIYELVDSRYWYLADGVNSFYLSNLKYDIHYMFINRDNDPNYLNKMVLKKTLMGGDFLIRTINGRELSIITSDGLEFIYQENVWRFRDYNQLRALVASEVKLDEKVYNAIIYYVLYCSKNDISSILWIPKDISKIKSLVKSPHVLASKSFNVIDASYESLIKRLLSSDGATVIQSDGQVKYYGCIVDMQNKDSKKIKGTGETAAGKLASNGIAFKISQDGTIKLFLNDKTKVIKF